MTPIGHSIVGASFAVLGMPRRMSRTAQLASVTCVVFAANIPDWPLPHWGHQAYGLSHSIIVNAGLILVTLLAAIIARRNGIVIPTSLLIAGAAAWLSHFFLDSMYNHGRGLATFWPLSASRLNLALPWFRTLDLSQSILGDRNFSVLVVEFIAYSPVLLFAFAVRWIWFDRIDRGYRKNLPKECRDANSRQMP